MTRRSEGIEAETDTGSRRICALSMSGTAATLERSAANELSIEVKVKEMMGLNKKLTRLRRTRG